MPDATAPTQPRVSIDPRIRRRRIEVRRDEGRRRLRLIVAASSIVGVVLAGWGVLRSPVLDVDRIEVTGAAHTPDAAVVAAAGVHTGQAMTAVEEHRAAVALRRLPWVASAKVHRDWPGTVRIDVRERRPAASVRGAGEGWMLVDASGRVLGAIPLPDPKLPAIENTPRALHPGDQLAAMAQAPLAVARRIPSERVNQVRVVAILEDGSIELRLMPRDKTPPGIVRFGAADQIDAKLIAAFTILDKVDLRRLAVIDVRVPSAPVVTRR